MAQCFENLMTMIMNDIVGNRPFIGSLMSDQPECPRPHNKVKRKFTFSDEDIKMYDGINHFRKVCKAYEVFLAQLPPTPYPTHPSFIEPLPEHKSSITHLEHKSSLAQSNLSVPISNDVLFVKFKDSPKSHVTDLYPSIKVTDEKVDSNCNWCLVM